MADPVSWAVMAAVGAGVAKGVGNFMGANKDQQAAEERARVGALQADQYEASARNDMERQISNIVAVRASVGMSNSPTQQAIIDRERTLGFQQIERKATNYRVQSEQDKIDAGTISTMKYIGAFGDGLSTISSGIRAQA